MKYCLHCGAEVNENAVICVKCGIPITPSAPTAPAAQAAKPAYTPAAPSTAAPVNNAAYTPEDRTPSGTVIFETANRIKTAMIVSIAASIVPVILSMIIVALEINFYWFVTLLEVVLGVAVAVIILLAILKAEKEASTSANSFYQMPYTPQITTETQYTQQNTVEAAESVEASDIEQIQEAEQTIAEAVETVESAGIEQTQEAEQSIAEAVESGKEEEI